jgi:hypothetical protein
MTTDAPSGLAIASLVAATRTRGSKFLRLDGQLELERPADTEGLTSNASGGLTSPGVRASAACRPLCSESRALA